ncbi:MAG TPA: ATP-binding protein [Lachnospiraceae bacterium]|nr:ATP-binding protein [Lachnospiraceae bacterium]
MSSNIENIAEQVGQLNKALENQYDILKALCADYISIYKIDFNTGKYEIYQTGNLHNKEIAEKTRSLNDYKALVRWYASEYVIQEDMDYFCNATSEETIMKHLLEKKDYVIRYRAKGLKQDFCYFDIQYADVSHNPGEKNVIMAIRNVDAVVRTEEEMRRNTASAHEETLKGSGIGMWMIVIEEGVKPKMYTDSMMRELLGVDDEILPEDCYAWWYDHVDKNFVSQIDSNMEEILAKGRSEVSYPYNHPDKGTMYIRCGGCKSYDSVHNRIRIKGYHQDVTEIMTIKQKQDKELMDALVVAKRADRSKSEFISHMSHDIRTPINGIIGMVDIASKNPEDAELQKRMCNNVRESAQRLLNFMNDVIEYSEMEGSRMKLTHEPVDIANIIGNILELTDKQINDRNIQVVTDYGNDTYKLAGSLKHIRQVLYNIIENAIKYNKQNGSISISVHNEKTDEEKAECFVTVADTGIGMSREYVEHIFEPFTQGYEDARTSYKGTGLGMAICKRIMDYMQGTIEVKTNPGEGSEFTVKFPLDIYEEDTVTDENAENDNFAGYKILIVDDNNMNREITQFMVEELGAKAVTTCDGKEALDTFRKSERGDFDCIIMDLMMPVMDGFEASERIRNLDREDAHTIPIIPLSASSSEEDMEKAVESGMNGYLVKPVSIDLLKHTLQNMI